MVRWSWGIGRKVALLSAMAGLSALIVWWFLRPGLSPGAMIGGISFLTIPQMLTWISFVGLRTGMLPQRGRVVRRADEPVEFWVMMAGQAALLAMFVGALAIVALG
jgi:hypothetical protein